MSRVGKYPVAAKEGVNISFDGNKIVAKGKKGELSFDVPANVSIKVDNNQVTVSPIDDTVEARKIWGTVRAIVNNMVIGVSEGFKTHLIIEGVGYRASLQGKNLVLQLGFSHDVVFPVPAGVNITCQDQNNVIIEGIDKHIVGQVAANIRSYKKPEPYKGKGIRYSDEVVLRKEGKKK
jgi:large subunit ribosomal protein L6